MKLSDLLQNPLNRKIDRAKVAEIKRAINTSGVIKPLVYTEVMTEKGKENMLTDGHHRYVALKEMGYKDAPVVMSDERGIETAQHKEMRAVKKGITALRSLSKHLQGRLTKEKKPCREGSYRDKDGNCRRRGQRYGYGSGGILIHRPKHTKPHNGNGHHGTGNGSTSSNSGVTKHLQGKHDERSHGRRGGVRGAISREYRRKPTTRREATTRGAVKGGAVHLGTIAIPALATAAIIRGASYFRFGVIGAGAALVIYEAPQFAFRVIEGSVREKKEFARQSRLKKAEAQTDRANRPISRGDHLLVMYKKGANIGVYIGDGKARLINGPKFEDVRTSKHNRLKIASGHGVPGIEQPNKTRRILRQVKREQTAIGEAVKQIKEKQVTKRAVDKHAQHNQQDHDPTRGKSQRIYIKSIRPALREGNRIFSGRKGQNHGQVYERNAGKYNDEEALQAGYVDKKGKWLSREDLRRLTEMSTGTSEELAYRQSEKFVKHGTHNQKTHGRRGKGKDTSEVRQLRAQLRPAFRVRGKIYAGKRGQIHAEIINQFPRGDKDLTDAVSGFVDAKGNFMTRKQTFSRVGQGETVSIRGRTLQDRLEDLESKKVTKHTPGGQGHDQQRHDPTGGRGQGALQQEARSRLRGSSKHKQLRRELNSLAADPNKPGNKERMNAIHQQLAEQAREARGEIRREPKPAITSLNDVKNHLSLGTKVLLSAERSNLPTVQNTQRTAALRDELKTLGSDIMESDSKSGGIQEKGFVISISPKTLRNIKQLVHKYNQDSVIVIQDGKAELRFSDGRTEYADVSEATERVGDDDYSTIGGVRFTIPFKDRRRELKRKMIKDITRVRDLLTKVNRLTKEGVASSSVSGLALSREDLQSTMAHPHPGHVKKHVQHNQKTHGRRSGIAPSRINTSAIKVAQRYLSKAGLPGLTRHTTVKVDEARARRIANAYDSMTHDPKNPQVVAAYKAMADEVAAQYKMLPVKIEYTKDDPYPNSKAMRRDVRVNKRLRIFTGGEKHPLLGAKGQDGATINDNFRAVHDYFGHAMRGYKFGPSGEENAWMEHSKMFSPLAQRAMTTETRGQNSWFNFSRNNEGKEPKNRVFARTKVGILPDEFLPRKGIKKQDTSEALRDVQEKIYKRLKKDVQKHTPGGQQHDQSTHGRRTSSTATATMSVKDSLIMSIRPAVKIRGRVYSGKQGSFHADVAQQHGFGRFTGDRGFVDRRGNWMEREEVGDIIGGEGLSEDLVGVQDELKPVRVMKRKKYNKGWATQDSFRLSQKMDMDEGVNTKRPYKNVEGANVEGGRV